MGPANHFNLLENAMENYFELCLAPDDIRAISSVGLAHLGDAVYELLVRTYLCAGGKATGQGGSTGRRWSWSGPNPRPEGPTPSSPC